MEGEEKRTKRKSSKKSKKEKEAPPPEEQQSSTETTTTTTTTTTTKAEDVRKKSPGKYEDINKEAKAALGMNELFDGFRVEYNRGLADVFSVNHAFSLGSTMEPPSYNFGASYVLMGRTGPLAMLWGRIDTDSHMIGRVQSNLTSKLVLTTGVQCSNEAHQSTAHAELEYKGDDFHMQTKWLNPGNYGISYLQTITRNLAMGCDIFYNHKQGLAVATLGGRWSDGINISSVVFTYGHLTASYTRKVNDRVNLCTELVFQQAQTGLDSVWTTGVHYNFRTTNLRTSLASSGKVSCIYEEMLNPYSKFQMCGELDHAKKQYRFGLGFQLGV